MLQSIALIFVYRHLYTYAVYVHVFISWFEDDVGPETENFDLGLFSDGSRLFDVDIETTMYST